ncbi:hypothetical protein QYF68_26130 [Mycolicibacterium austroafricanum]|uniref:Integral membrane protein n=1 Tax=Mycolicibacterium austroafricanum TaxID=39687 RepID=A0ABT8HKI9_MYCAO|nr:hypothetical protein [Mycolicibacterium austroafricanum]MDN4521274.1 hypothetical protein [Mycolicibacterium austroafricanum]
MWALTALLLIASLLLGFGWVLLATGCGAAAYFTQARSVAWPPDLGDLLAQLRLTEAAPPNTVPNVAPTAVIPFRPLTFHEIFGGAFRVMTRNWPTLVGIPTAILATFFVVFSLVMWIVGAVATASMSVSTSLFDSGDPATDLTRMFSGLMGLMIVLTLLFAIAALPADALLLGLSTIATGKAIRGEPVRVTSVLADAKGSMLAVCRLTLCYYGLFFVFGGIAMTLVFVATLVSMPLGILLMVAVFVASFGVGVLYSLAPIVLIVEKRGVIDAFKRSAQLAKPAAGRLLGIHLLWMVCVTAVLLIPGTLAGLVLGEVGAALLFAVAFGALIAYFRSLQMLIYTDLRIRQERFDIELASEWARNARY